MDFDQLNYLKSEGFIFRGYSEDKVKFPPTYKYDPGTNQFDTSSKKRVPSYTGLLHICLQLVVKVSLKKLIYYHKKVHSSVLFIEYSILW